MAVSGLLSAFIVYLGGLAGTLVHNGVERPARSGIGASPNRR
jgi:hypothetical protein